MPQTKFATAYRKDTGEQVRIPAHWFDHPTLGKSFRKTKPEPKASTSTTSSSSSPTAATSGSKEK